MIWRAMEVSELEECLAIDPRSIGDALIGRRRAITIWKQLLRNPAFNHAVVDTEKDFGTPAIAAFGASLFLYSGYADRELQQPRPDLNSRIFSGIASGEPLFAPEDSLTGPLEKNALDLVLLCSSFRQHGLSPDQQAEAGMALPQALLHVHVGYPIQRILMETTNERMRQLAVASGTWKMAAHFPACDRALLVCTREEVLASPGFSLLAPLFHYRPPVLHLRKIDKQLLSEALNGETDADLAAKMHLSLSSIKKRWLSLFLHVAEKMPELLPIVPQEIASEKRGLQKRHRVLAHVRSHPEELRPFRWYPKP